MHNFDEKNSFRKTIIRVTNYTAQNAKIIVMEYKYTKSILLKKKINPQHIRLEIGNIDDSDS